MKLKFKLLATFLGLIAISAFYFKSEGSQSVRRETGVTINGAERFYGGGLRDWVSFADHVVKVAVIHESWLDLTEEEKKRGEGYLGREITLQIEQLIWSNPEQMKPPVRINFFAAGAVVRDHMVIPAQIAGSTRLDVGDRAIVPLIYVPNEGWMPLTPSGIMLLGENMTRKDPVSTTEAVSALSGMSVDQIARKLKSVLPYDQVRSSMAMDAVKRMRLVHKNFSDDALTSQ